MIAFLLIHVDAPLFDPFAWPNIVELLLSWDLHFQGDSKRQKHSAQLAVLPKLFPELLASIFSDLYRSSSCNLLRQDNYHNLTGKMRMLLGYAAKNFRFGLLLKVDTELWPCNRRSPSNELQAMLVHKLALIDPNWAVLLRISLFQDSYVFLDRFLRAAEKMQLFEDRGHGTSSSDDVIRLAVQGHCWQDSMAENGIAISSPCWQARVRLA